MSLDALNRRVTNAIIRAESLPPGSRDAWEAFHDVSALEESIATLLPPDDLEGEIARLGAVTAALSAGSSVLLPAEIVSQSPDARRRDLRAMSKKALIELAVDRMSRIDIVGLDHGESGERFLKDMIGRGVILPTGLETSTVRHLMDFIQTAEQTLIGWQQKAQVAR